MILLICGHLATTPRQPGAAYVVVGRCAGNIRTVGGPSTQSVHEKLWADMCAAIGNCAATDFAVDFHTLLGGTSNSGGIRSKPKTMRAYVAAPIRNSVAAYLRTRAICAQALHNKIHRPVLNDVVLLDVTTWTDFHGPIVNRIAARLQVAMITLWGMAINLVFMRLLDVASKSEAGRTSEVRAVCGVIAANVDTIAQSAYV